MKFFQFKISSKIKFDFHVSRESRLKYNFDKSLFSVTGDLIVANFHEARILSEKINFKRKEEGNDQLVTAGQINAIGLLHEIFHFVLRLYEEKENPFVFSRGIDHLKNNLGEEELNKTFLEYLNDFPPLDVFTGKITTEDYLNGFTDNRPNKEIIFEELILLYLENNNPATIFLEELYSDKQLAEKSQYISLIDETEKFFVTEKPFGAENLPLMQFLRMPVKDNPYNIEGQLDFIKDKWGIFIYKKFYDKILGSKDLIHEDYKLFVHHGGGEKATPPVPVYSFDAEFFEKLRAKIAAGEQLTADEAQFYYAETEQFTTDIDWMPKVVMMAKNIFVWLDQLSKKYQREIKTLDQIPDEELNNLAMWNFTAVWLIGVWERSSASKKVKHFTGNPDAVSSAYSLYDYVIAQEIGGEDAFLNLKHRCWERGIRLSSDMVPNHTGIYSKWVVEKPGYFIKASHPPYPGYSFNGPNLSDDDRVEIRIEDKYYNRSDAAVVFQRRDSYTGDAEYIYHGNDGTHMPWNDTAQLDLLKAEVRESLIQTIMHVARKTPIIRFDAAMTLAKKHYQRLWFPQPGTGGAVPSRSDYAMTRAAFDEAMPVEFWREVVDRINSEMPQTLLLAEAFWMMEGYFVRTLGMHRVYNSAFMHMMMKEENQKYRELMKNTLEFNPEILKRYVNFMSNPDEETAVNQFGKGDKYFGVCVMMITMPGLPMFAHGQVEGFAEKYGMEYKRAYYEEFIDDNLVRRHESEIFPLAQKRYLFSQVYDFELYDFIDNYGNINENVFAFSNRSGDEKAFIIYNNSYEECSGTINYAAPKASSSGALSVNRLADAIGFKNDPMFFYIFKESRTNLEYIIRGKDVFDHGFFSSLSGYEYKAFMDFREVYDNTGIYNRVAGHLNGKGVPSIEYMRNELQLGPVHSSLRELFTPDNFKSFKSNFITPGTEAVTTEDKNILEAADKFISEFNNISNIPVDKEIVLDKIKDEMSAVRELSKTIEEGSSKKRIPQWIKDLEKQSSLYSNGEEPGDLLFPLLVFKNISAGWLLLDSEMNRNIFDTLHLDDVLFQVLQNREHQPGLINSEIRLVKLLSLGDALYNSETAQLKQKFPDESKKITEATKQKAKQNTREYFLVNEIFNLNKQFNYLNVNEYKGVSYYHKENFENLINWICTLELVEDANKFLVQREERKKKITKQKKAGTEKTEIQNKNFINAVKKDLSFFSGIKELSARSDYKVEELKKLSSVQAKEKKDTA